MRHMPPANIGYERRFEVTEVTPIPPKSFFDRKSLVTSESLEGQRGRLWSKVSKVPCKLHAFPLFGVNEKCDVLHMPPRGSLRPEDSPPSPLA
jgi:hypothetical protein